MDDEKIFGWVSRTEPLASGESHSGLTSSRASSEKRSVSPIRQLMAMDTHPEGLKVKVFGNPQDGLLDEL